MSTSNLKHLFEVLTARPFLTVLMFFVAAVGSVGHGTGDELWKFFSRFLK